MGKAQLAQYKNAATALRTKRIDATYDCSKIHTFIGFHILLCNAYGLLY